MPKHRKARRWLVFVAIGTVTILVRFSSRWTGFVPSLRVGLLPKGSHAATLANSIPHCLHKPAWQRQDMSYVAMGCTIFLSFAMLRGRRCTALAHGKPHAVCRAARETYDGAPIAPPPDLPSLLLKNRIVYLGAPITSEVTELIVAQLLYLNYESADKPVTMYINSTGSTLKNSTKYVGENKVGMETDAFAIADCMQYIKPQVHTIAIGQAYGTAAMLLALGAKGKRFALPNTTIMLSEPREPPARGPRQASDIRILAREVLQNRSTMAEQIAKSCGKTTDEVIKDTQRCKYMSPEEAVEYNLVDKVLSADKLKEHGPALPSFISAL